MGATSAVSRNVANMFFGERKLALRYYEKLIAKINSSPLFRPQIYDKRRIAASQRRRIRRGKHSVNPFRIALSREPKTLEKRSATSQTLDKPGYQHTLSHREVYESVPTLEPPGGKSCSTTEAC